MTEAQNKENGNGFVLSMFVMALAAAVFLAVFVMFILIGADMFDLIIDVKTEVYMPAISEIGFNSFMELQNSYPTDNNLMRNIFVMYNVSGDTVMEDIIIDNKILMFSNHNVMLSIGSAVFNPLSGNHAVAERKIPLPGGLMEKTILRLFE